MSKTQDDIEDDYKDEKETQYQREIEGEGEAQENRPAKGTRMSAGEIYDNVRETAEEEMRRPTTALMFSAVAAGLTIGFSFLAATYLTTLVPERYESAATAVGYPLGFIFVVLARSQLFTENTLEPIIPLLHSPSFKTLRRLLHLWMVILVGNFIGTLAFGAILAFTPMFEREFHTSLLKLAEGATSGEFGINAYKSIYSGWLIALMAWLIASTRSTSAQLVLVWLTTAPIAAFKFPHSVAGAVEAFYLAFVGHAAWGDMIGHFIVPTILGNIVGGVLFVALLNHGQVAADRSARLFKKSYTN